MVSTQFKTISQNGNLPQIGVKNKHIFETTTQNSLNFLTVRFWWAHGKKKQNWWIKSPVSSNVPKIASASYMFCESIVMFHRSVRATMPTTLHPNNVSPRSVPSRINGVIAEPELSHSATGTLIVVSPRLASPDRTTMDVPHFLARLTCSRSEMLRSLYEPKVSLEMLP